jgi:predicted metal-dependent hydrolase
LLPKGAILFSLPKSSSVFFGTTEIIFTIRPANRKTLAIHVFPDGEVVTDVPQDANEFEIAEKVKRKGAWILKQKRLFASYPPVIPSRQYISGERLSYLGRHYRLKVHEGTTRAAKLIGRFLEVTYLQGDAPQTVEYLVRSWLRSKALIAFESLMKVCVARTAKIGVTDIPSWRMLHMRKRWGSCTRSGMVILNPELVAAPKDCVEYVIIHELCHLKIKNHSSSYYRLLSQIIPDWEHLRMRLNCIVELRLDY